VRVVFFLQGERVPASRARGFAIAGALERAGITCSVRPARPSVYGDTRLPGPLARPRWLYQPFAAISRLGQLRDLRDDDVVFFQRPMIQFPTTVFERRAARGRRTVFDFDDAIFEGRGTRAKFPRLIALADRVVAGNAYLAEAAGAPDKTVVIPTAVDTERFSAQPASDARGAGVVVGWTGLSSNYRQLAIAAPAIARALRRTGASFLAISNEPPPPALADLRAEFLRWRPETEVADLARIDIGLMPLPDRPYERGKCAFKLIQHMALARPVVGSPVGANRTVVTDGVDGFLAADDGAWEDALVRLITDPDLRLQMGQRARARVEAAYSLNAVVPRYRQIFEELGAR